MCRCAFGKLPRDHKAEVYKIIISKCLPIAKRRVNTCHVGLLNFATTGLLAHAGQVGTNPTVLDRLHGLPKLATTAPTKFVNLSVDLIEVAHATIATLDWSFSAFATFL